MRELLCKERTHGKNRLQFHLFSKIYLELKRVSYLFLPNVVQITFNERLYQVKRAEIFSEGFSNPFAEVSNTLKGDFGPLVFVPGNNF